MQKMVLLIIGNIFLFHVTNAKELLENSSIANACKLDHETYATLDPQKKSAYSKAIACELNKGTISPEQIISTASCPLRHDVARCCYLSYGKLVNLNTPSPAFSIRMLINHKRLNRTIASNGNLDLSHLHIADLDGIESIPNIQSVRTLNLSHNQISLLHPENFKTLTGLRNLDISFNNLSSIRPKTFKHLAYLNTLNMSHNHITNLDQDTFLGLTQLHELDLSHNKLEWVGIGSLKDLDQLASLNMSNNRLQLISPRVMNPLANVKTLDISHNNFTIIHSQALHPLRQLQQLDVSNNHLTRITEDALYGLKQLKILNLQNNQLVMVNFQTPHILPNLNAIVLGNNPIKTKRLNALRAQLPNVKIFKNNPKSAQIQASLEKK